jgi:hypothetical protein
VKRRDAGQATLEYIFILFTAVAVFALVFNVFLKPLGSKFANYLNSRFNKVLTQGDLHSLPFKSN